ncbi:MAG TPA: hypothetical protein VKP69_00405, partial [Isosphaeraceae bacterium]|nr:hypothetical protein [Isosphaeraceae bacterium]
MLATRGARFRAGLAATAVLAGLLILFAARPGGASWIWVEGEQPMLSTMHRHPWWYDQVRRDQLSGGDLISNFHSEPGVASYRVTAPAAGAYEFWARANPVASRLSYQINGGRWVPIEMEKGEQDTVNIALDQKIDLRFLAWIKAGKVALKKGDNLVRFRMDSANHNHGYLDCFVFSSEPFRPSGMLKPGQIAEANRRAVEADKGWFAFDPPPDPFEPTSGFDLRSLNEPVAGEGGFIGVKGSQFIHTKTGQPVRFWAVHGPSGKDRETLRREARMLAKHGVNLVRIDAGDFNENGDVDMAKVWHAIDIVETMEA